MDVHGHLIAGGEQPSGESLETIDPATGEPLARFAAGDDRSSGGSFETIDPSTGEPLARFAAGDAATVEAAVAAAVAAAEPWRRLGAVARGAIMRRAARLCEERAEAIAAEITREVGKPIAESRAEVARAAVTLAYVAEQARLPVGDVFESDDPSATVLTRRRPLGVVAIVTPWNFPFNLPVWKLAPALVHGNAVVWKPAEESPLAALRIAELLADAGLPDGVLNVVFGDARAGAPLVAHDAVDGVSFTGSTAVGERIAQVVAGTGARYQSELGGKNPLVVLPDADLDEAVALAVAGGTSYAGQKCSATSRVIAVGGIADALVERLTAAFDAVVVGDPADPATRMGPLIDAAARERALAAVARATDDGAVLRCGGDPLPGAGWFMRPALLDGAAPDAPLVQEEIFGPVVAVQRADDVDAAVALVNGTRYGFFAGVCTRELSVVTELAGRLDAGVVRVNAVTAGADPHIPLGGFKASGNLAPEMGLAAREFYTRVQAVYLR
jgi:alpha-ketoglutaric semialdehyde dehydrogenase